MKATELLVACFALFGACLLWPLLAIANRPVLILGVPALALYLFAVWAAIVVVLIVSAVRRRASEEDE
jgi:membrane protein implicated in regulation of membrane protease activity